VKPGVRNTLSFVFGNLIPNFKFREFHISYSRHCQNFKFDERNFSNRKRYLWGHSKLLCFTALGPARLKLLEFFFPSTPRAQGCTYSRLAVKYSITCPVELTDGFMNSMRFFHPCQPDPTHCLDPWDKSSTLYMSFSSSCFYYYLH